MILDRRVPAQLGGLCSITFAAILLDDRSSVASGPHNLEEPVNEWLSPTMNRVQIATFRPQYTGFSWVSGCNYGVFQCYLNQLVYISVCQTFSVRSFDPASKRTIVAPPPSEVIGRKGASLFA